jgi:hypothetical protein
LLATSGHAPSFFSFLCNIRQGSSTYVRRACHVGHLIRRYNLSCQKAPKAPKAPWTRLFMDTALRPKELTRMTVFGTLGQKLHRGMFLAILAALFCNTAWTQEDKPVPLGDVARSLRKKKQDAQQQAPPAPAPSRPIIDNDNFSQVLEDAETHHLTSSNFVYSFDRFGRTFQVSSPDISCSLSFNARAASLISRPYVQLDLPDEEMRKLEGPAAIDEEGLQVSVFNGTQWKVEEITVGVTLVRRPTTTAGYYGAGKLVPAASETTTVKQPDVTTLLHLKASASPASTTVFKGPLNFTVGPDQEWHWAIVQARGYPPKPENSALASPLTAPSNAVVP